MSQTVAAPAAPAQTVGEQARKRRGHSYHSGKQGQWWRFAVLLVITAIVLVPIAFVFVLSTQPSLGSNASGFTLDNFVNVFTQTGLTTWLTNSLIVTLATVLVAVVVAAPAGYVLSRVRNRLVSSYSLTLFVIQSLPVITAVIPLFTLFPTSGWWTTWWASRSSTWVPPCRWRPG